MGPPPKGKKAWRKNLDDSEVVEFVQQQTHQERRGPAVETLKDDELFFVDKGPADSNAEALLAQAQQPAKKKREKRPTRAQLILSAPQKIKPVVPPKGAPKKDQGPINPQNARLEQLKKQQEKAAQLERQKQWIAKQSGPAALDVWGDSVPSAGEDAEAGPGPGSTQLALVGTTGAPNGHLATFLEDLPEATLREGRSAKRSNGRRQISPGPIKPVEIDMAGCSYNPDTEAHQDAIAVLVANEMKKELKKALEPQAIPKLLDAPQLDQLTLDEIEALQTVADEDDNEIPLDLDGGEETGDEGGAGAKAKLASKKSRKDRNREARRQAEEKAAAERAALKRQRQQLEALPKLASEIQEEEQIREAKRLRRQIVQEEKALTQPPKLGKHKFEDMPVQVLTSDELGGGLRRLKPTAMLAAERFKSLQKRGLIEPRKPVAPKQKKLVIYEKDARRERAIAGQQELDKLRAANIKAKKAARPK